QRGKEYLARFALQDEIRKLRIDENIRYYDLVLAGKSIGYLTRRFTREQQALDDPSFGKAGKEGLRVREQSWRFGDDGSARFSDFNLFSSVDGTSDLYEGNETVIPPESAPDGRRVTYRDQYVREGEVLFATYFSSLDVDRPDPRRPLKIEPTYVG